MLFVKLKLVAGVIVAAGAALVLIAATSAGPLGQPARGIEPTTAEAQSPPTTTPTIAQAKNGSFVFDRLLPGANYHVYASGRWARG